MADCYANGKVPVFPCGGGSNTGEIADPVARQMQKNNLGKMNCLASLGAHLDGFIISARRADLNIPSRVAILPTLGRFSNTSALSPDLTF